MNPGGKTKTPKKMKNMIVMIILLLGVISSSCTSRSGKRQEAIEDAASVSTQRVVTVGVISSVTGQPFEVDVPFWTIDDLSKGDTIFIGFSDYGLREGFSRARSSIYPLEVVFVKHLTEE